MSFCSCHAKMIILMFVLGLLLLTFSGCGDLEDDALTELSGLDRDMLLSDLDTDQRVQACKWKNDLLTNAYNTQNCTKTGINLSVYSEETISDCNADDKEFPKCSVSIWEDCYEKLAEVICESESPDECDLFVKCYNAQQTPQNSNACLSVFGCDSFNYGCEEDRCESCIETCSDDAHCFAYETKMIQYCGWEDGDVDEDVDIFEFGCPDVLCEDCIKSCRVHVSCVNYATQMDEHCPGWDD